MAWVIECTTIPLFPVSSDFQFLPDKHSAYTKPKPIEKWVLHLSLAGDFVYGGGQVLINGILGNWESPPFLIPIRRKIFTREKLRRPPTLRHGFRVGFCATES